MDNSWSDTPDYTGERDTNVLYVIGEEELTNFTFDGLKRRLGVHSETLSRILYRLEERGIVQKGTGGYNVTPKARELLKSHPAYEPRPKMPLLQTLLSPDIPVERIVSSLRGRWFGVLRWVGYSESPNGTALKWLTEDGAIQVEAVFSESSLSIEAKLLSENDLNKALRASYQLVGYIAKLYSKPTQIKPVAYSVNFNPYWMPS